MAEEKPKEEEIPPKEGEQVSGTYSLMKRSHDPGSYCVIFRDPRIKSNFYR